MRDDRSGDCDDQRYPPGFMRMHYFKEATFVLGPGERSALWLQGCRRDCPGCMSQEARKLDAGQLIATDEVIGRVLQAGKRELTISGGEPFLQSRELAVLVRTLREQGVGIILYSGYTLEQLEEMNDPDIRQVLGHIDLLIDGEYVEERNDGRANVGSSNQRILRFTDRYSDDIMKKTYEGARVVEIEITGDTVFVAGIPSRDMLSQIKSMKGNPAFFSE